MADFTPIKSAVLALTSVVDSVLSFIDDLQQKLQDAIDGGDEEEVQNIVNEINAQRLELANAIAANTAADDDQQPTGDEDGDVEPNDAEADEAPEA